MKEGAFYRRTLKLEARQTILRQVAPFLLAAAMLVIFSIVAGLTSTVTQSRIYYGVLDAQEFPVQTGLWKADVSIMSNLLSMMGLNAELGSLGGVVLALQDSAGEKVAVVPVAWRLLLQVVGVSFIFFLLAVPLQYGVTNRFWRLLRGENAPFGRIFSWYSDLRLTGKALAVEIVRAIWQWGTGVLAMVPALFCMAAGSTAGQEGLLLLATPLTVLGLLGAYYLSTLLFPVRYLLSANPELSLRQAFSQGLRILSGRRREYFWLNLSFLPWRLVSALLSNLPDLYVVPYVEVSNYLFLSGESRQEPPQAV